MIDASEAIQYMANVLNDYELKTLHLEADNVRLREALKEHISIVKIHSDNTDNDFAWAEMAEARAALGKED